MSRKLLALALGLGLAAAACARAPVAPQLGSGSGFVAQVVDPLNDAGRFPSVAVVDGRPVVAYFAFEEQVPEGGVPETRPIGAPSLPGVMLATEEGGVWSRGAIAIAEQIPNVQVAFNPAFERSVGRLTPESVTGLQLVADAAGTLHAVWGSADGVFYATGTGDPAAATQWTVERVTRTPGLAPSIAVDTSGTPWVAYLASGSAETSIEVASPVDGEWRTEEVATGAGCPTCGTAAVASGDGVAVAFADGERISVATRTERGRWETVEVGPGEGGLAANATADGIAISYYADDEVRVATGPSEGPFTTEAVGSVAAGSATAEGARTSIAADGSGTLLVVWTDAEAGVAMATGDGKTFTPVDAGTATAGGTMPSAAATADGARRFVAWYDPGPQDLLLGVAGDVGELAIGRVSPTPTAPPAQPTTAPPTEECAPVVDGKVTVVAEGLAFTDGACIQAPAGEPFTIVFENRDAGVQHNVQVFAGAQPSGDTLFQGDIITGPSQIEYEIPALDPGEYAYNCIVHPNMIGRIVAGEAAGPTGPTGATGPGGEKGQKGEKGAEELTSTVVAQAMAFDTATIVLPANREHTITFENKDAGVQHNIAIYRDSSLSEQLFNGELITGPATTTYTIPPLPPGEYYFLCIVHPMMNGTVIVR
ncbi:MAG: hypothetical protein KatS3mg014_2359 [Actinomycetota bacterium]|nr:MAG: hypothetical protein KatS3mg014_2359 [Actinomycetota bacterium]